MLSVADAVTRAISLCQPVTASEDLDLFSAAGRVVAAGIRSPCALPRFDHSAMDGFAVRAASFTGNGPWTFRIAARVAAGDHTVGRDFESAEAVEIFTGAMIPADFDTVIIGEKCSRHDRQFTTAYRPRPGENIRRAGEDVDHDALLFKAGTVLTPHKIALLAAAGLSRISVVRKIRLGFITTGSELKEPGEPLGAGQIYNSNRYLLASMLAHPWLEVHDLGSIPDTIESTTELIHGASMHHDIVVTSGGLSKGGEDHVRDALTRCGGSLGVLDVAMRPGKPVSFGTLGSALFIGLPGNPMAAAVTLDKIALPAIRAVAGIEHRDPVWMMAISDFALRKKEGRTEFVPVRVQGRDASRTPVVAMLGRGSSGSLSPMAHADGVAILPPELVTIERGMPLRFEPFAM
ncbi:molybdenum cofactor synthesis domain-containing protein [Agrobacterium albertimagni AOL15]|uniref:Molybdopterin molybdenumtransferase n=2 Tax=Agrobacterium albertimagni TaxID=147266 RepID=K2R0Z4_9HYPH|nr:molybdenum cofactor synthesis domain-containing protein [Agrobacterium albertimagni AOL15]